MAGMAAGLRLALYGKKTLVLERHSRPGGLNSWYRAGGYQLDVGLHALTNYNPAAGRDAPLNRLLRRLRLSRAALALAPQKESWILHYGAKLVFNNDFACLLDNAQARFPGAADGLRKLAAEARRHYMENRFFTGESARARLPEFIADPMLREMILMPVMFYGCAGQEDMDWGQFLIIFMSVFEEGLCRPQGGIRAIIDLLTERLERAGGELRLKAGVRSVITRDGAAAGVILDNGEVIEGGAVFSSAGWVESAALCPEMDPAGDAAAGAGVMSFLESIHVLDRPAAQLGLDASIIFYNNAPRFSYRKPDAPVDLNSGVVCVAGNFGYESPLPFEQIRVTHIANPDYWMLAPDKLYLSAKEEWRARSLASLPMDLPDFRSAITFHDTFTPRTIHKFTGKLNGAVYGAPAKHPGGDTPVKGLYVIGTDQGLLGVTGAMIGGVAVAARAALV